MTGFIKAFSDNPESLSSGFTALEKVLKALWVRKCLLVPRFHSTICDYMQTCPPRVYEISVRPTARVVSIQQALKTLLLSTIRELKRSRPDVDLDHTTPDQSLFLAYEQMIRKQLDPVWHSLGSTVKQHIIDLRTLRVLMQYVDQYDAVSFLQYLEVSHLQICSAPKGR